MKPVERLKAIPDWAATQAGNVKADAAAAVRKKAAGLREAIGPEKIEPVKPPQRPFGREGGEDIKQIVWTGHTVQSTQGMSYYGAVGQTESGYYRAAEVQVYGADEQWRWQAERHSLKDDAINSAQRATTRIRGGRIMAENKISPEVEARAKLAVESAGARINSVPVQAEKQSPAIDTMADGGRALERARVQARQAERLAANHDHKQPSKE